MLYFFLLKLGASAAQPDSGQRSEGVSDVGAQAIVRVTRRGVIPCSVPDLRARRRALS